MLKHITRQSPIRIDFNAPFSLWFAFSCCGAYLSSWLTGGWTLQHIFSISSEANFLDWTTYPRLILHIFGHTSLEHLLSNLMLLLLVGPLLERVYGDSLLILLSLVTAICTGLLMTGIFSGSLAGASGVVFAMIVLASFANARSGTIPLTFVLVAALFIGGEVIQALSQDDNVARFAHLAGGAIGTLFGFLQIRSSS